MGFSERKRVLFLGLPLSFTKYEIGEEKVTLRRGFLNIVEDDTFMYKIQDVRLTKSFFERIAGLGTLICYTGDITHPEMELKHIKHTGEIKDFILKQSEEARIKRRTIHTMDIDGDFQSNPEVEEQ